MTFVGRILHTDSSAYANTSFILYEAGNQGINNKKYSQTVPFTTDGNGGFQVKMAVKGEGVSICFPNKPSTDQSDAVAGTAGRTLTATNGVFDFGTIYYH